VVNTTVQLPLPHPDDDTNRRAALDEEHPSFDRTFDAFAMHDHALPTDIAVEHLAPRFEGPLTVAEPAWP
jgi:hypothetical protein